MYAVMVLGSIAAAVVLIVLLVAYLHNRPARTADKVLVTRVGELTDENRELKILVNRLDGMAQNEYDTSNNLFAHTVRQQISNYRKEIA